MLSAVDLLWAYYKNTKGVYRSKDDIISAKPPDD